MNKAPAPELKTRVALMARDATLEDHGPKRLWTTDVTSQALGSLLADNNEQISVLSAEGGLVLHKLLGISTADDQLLCAGFSGDSHAVDRISRFNHTASAVHNALPGGPARHPLSSLW